jgi:hypothetical protein
MPYRHCVADNKLAPAAKSDSTARHAAASFRPKICARRGTRPFGRAGGIGAKACGGSG